MSDLLRYAVNESLIELFNGVRADCVFIDGVLSHASKKLLPDVSEDDQACAAVLALLVLMDTESRITTGPSDNSDALILIEKLVVYMGDKGYDECTLKDIETLHGEMIANPILQPHKIAQLFQYLKPHLTSGPLSLEDSVMGSDDSDTTEGEESSPLQGSASPVRRSSTSPVRGSSTSPVRGSSTSPVRGSPSSPVHKPLSSPVQRYPSPHTQVAPSSPCVQGSPSQCIQGSPPAPVEDIQPSSELVRNSTNSQLFAASLNLIRKPAHPKERTRVEVRTSRTPQSDSDESLDEGDLFTGSRDKSSKFASTGNACIPAHSGPQRQKYRRLKVDENFSEQVDPGACRITLEDAVSRQAKKRREEQCTNPIIPEKKQRWTFAEECAFYQAAVKHGLGNWKRISYDLNGDRNPTQLKDKWRNILHCKSKYRKLKMLYGEAQ